MTASWTVSLVANIQGERGRPECCRDHDFMQVQPRPQQVAYEKKQSIDDSRRVIGKSHARNREQRQGENCCQAVEKEKDIQLHRICPVFLYGNASSISTDFWSWYIAVICGYLFLPMMLQDVFYFLHFEFIQFNNFCL